MPSSISTSSPAGLAGRFLLGIALVAAALEVCFRVLPVPTASLTGYHFDSRILTYPARHEWTSASGWDLKNPQRLRANNFGFVAGRDFAPDPGAIALIGDSFVEASALPPELRPDARLERLLGDRSVFSMAVPGSSLLDYVERIRFAVQKFNIRRAVIFMERGDVLQALCGSGNVTSTCLDRQSLVERTELQPAPSLAKRVLREVALAQYVVGQLRFNVGQIAPLARQQAIPAGPAAPVRSEAGGKPDMQFETAAGEAVARTFFSKLRTLELERLFVAIDCDRRNLDNPPPSRNDAALAPFMEMASKNRVVLIELCDAFRSHARVSPLKTEVGPYDAHLNAEGVEILVAEIARAVKADTGSQSAR